MGKPVYFSFRSELMLFCAYFNELQQFVPGFYKKWLFGIFWCSLTFYAQKAAVLIKELGQTLPLTRTVRVFYMS